MKFGILLPNLGLSQVVYTFINAANKYLEEIESFAGSVIAFYDELVPPCVQPAFACMQAYEMFNFGGIGIATNLNTAVQLINSPSPKKKIFYIWDLEWLSLGVFQYQEVADVYQNPQLQLVCRSESHLKAVKNAWNVAPLLVKDFDFKAYEQICR